MSKQIQHKGQDMTQMRRGFTMIELIFVIVIIGILAAVALPKLNATRTDAKVAAVVSNTKQVIDDVKNYYTAHGQTAYEAAKVSDITDVPLMASDCTTQLGSNDTFIGQKAYICSGTDGTIVEFDPTDKKNLVVSYVGDDSTDVETGVKNNSTFIGLAKSHRLGGQGITQ